MRRTLAPPTLRIVLPSLFAAFLGATAGAQVGCLQDRFASAGAEAGDLFGWRVDIDTLDGIVAAPLDDDAGTDAGAAYLFRLTAEWNEVQKLVGSESGTGDQFGRAVALANGVAIVGAPLASPGGQSSAGEAYIYLENAGTWIQTPVRRAGSPSPMGLFGFSVDISSVRAVVGAPFQDSTPLIPGAVYVFARQIAIWPQVQVVVPSAPLALEGFGTTVAMDGDWLFVGTGSGDRIYVFEWTGASYVQRQILFPSSPEDSLGWNPGTLSASQGRVIAAAPLADVGGRVDVGRVYVFEESGGVWSETQVLDDPFGRPGGEFGTTVSLDGADAVIGKPVDSDEAEAAGAAYLYEGQGQPLAFVFKITDGALSTMNAELGTSVAVDGGLVLASAAGAGTPSAAGEVSFFDSVLCMDPGTPQCLAAACPCGNDDPLAGCVNSTGFGARLRATGSSSIFSDDLRLIATGCPPMNSGLFFAADTLFPAPLTVGDGLGCAGGLSFRYLPGSVGPTGTFIRTDVVRMAPVGFIQPGDTRHFQAWTRDVLCGPPPAPCPTPCGAGSNLTNATTVQFTF